MTDKKYAGIESVLYVTPFVTDEILEALGISWFSPAGQNKMEGIVTALQKQNTAVTIVSPLQPQRRKLSYMKQCSNVCPETGAQVITPMTINFLGLGILNKPWLIISTTVTVLWMLYHDEFDGSIFYNFRPETAIPALAGQAFFDCPAILEYEDGLFAHKSTHVRLIAKGLQRLFGRYLRGAVCVNSVLADRLAIENISLVRGFPSVGMPETLPDPVERPAHPVIMFAGHFDRVRGIDKFLSVIPQINHKDVGIWISGTGRESETQRVREAVAELDDDRVIFFGTLPWEEYRRRIASADIFVNLQDPDAHISRYTFPSKLLDFLSAGGLIVSTDMSDIARTFDNELVIAGNSESDIADALSDAIEKIRDDGHSRTQSRMWVEEHCDYQVVGRHLHEVLDAAQ